MLATSKLRSVGAIAFAGAGGGARCADYEGHRPSSVGYDPSYNPDNEMSNSDGLENNGSKQNNGE